MGEAIAGLSEINSFATELNTSSFNIAAYLIAAMLAIALVFVVYALATNKPNSKEYLTAWIIALIFAVVFVIKSI
jgi:TctA family transporter